MQRSRVNNLARSILIIIRYSLPNFEITIWFERYGKPKYMNPPFPSLSFQATSLKFLSCLSPGGGGTTFFRVSSSIIYEKRKFLAWIQAKTIHQSINPQSRVELVENISLVPIFSLEPSSTSSFSVCRRRGEKKLDPATRHCELTNEWIINSALYIDTKKGCNLILTYFRVVFTSFGWTKRTSKWRNKREARSYSIVAFIFDRGEEREHVEGVIDGVLNR